MNPTGHAESLEPATRKPRCGARLGATTPGRLCLLRAPGELIPARSQGFPPHQPYFSFDADRAIGERLLHRLLADQEEKRGGDAGEPTTRLGLGEQQRSCRASLSGVTGSRGDRRFGGRPARIAGTRSELAWNDWGPLNVN